MSMKVHVYVVLIVALTTDFLFAQSNYQYDADGRLIADLSQGIVRIEWNNMSKITRIVRADTSHAADVEFSYSPTGDRVSKLVKPRTGNGLTPEQNWKYTYYVYNTSGSVLATYERAYEASTGQRDLYKEQYVAKDHYIGLKEPLGNTIQDKKMADHFFSATINSSGRFSEIQEEGNIVPPFKPDFIVFNRGLKRFQMSNHLDNILAVVGDRKVLKSNASYWADMASATDYYPFGMEMPSRTYNSETYRNGFAGKEKDNEIRGNGNSYDFNGRSIYDPRLGRFVSVDPQYRKGPDYSPYSYAFNNPLAFIDKSGEWPWDYRFKDLMSKDTNAEVAFLYGFLDGALDIGVTASKQLVKNNPAFMIFFAGEKMDQAKMIYKLATDSKLRNELIKGLKESFGDYLDKVGGIGNSAEVGYERGKFVFDFSLTVLPGAVKVASMASKGLKVAQAGAEAGAIVAKTGCFLGETEIRVDGDKFVYIRDIRTEENIYIISDEELKERGILEDQEMIKIIIDHWEMVVAADQLFMVKGSWKKAKDLKRGDKVATVKGGFFKIKRVIRQGIMLDKK